MLGFVGMISYVWKQRNLFSFWSLRKLLISLRETWSEKQRNSFMFLPINWDLGLRVCAMMIWWSFLYPQEMPSEQKTRNLLQGIKQKRDTDPSQISCPPGIDQELRDFFVLWRLEAEFSSVCRDLIPVFDQISFPLSTFFAETWLDGQMSRFAGSSTTTTFRTQDWIPTIWQDLLEKGKSPAQVLTPEEEREDDSDLEDINIEN